MANQTINQYVYYEFPRYQPERNLTKLVEEGQSLLSDATRMRLIADVPVGAFLSGGLDSSSIVAMMAQHTQLSNINTFSVGFEGSYDETIFINIANKFFGTKHHHIYFRKKEFEDILERMFYYFDEPLGDATLFPTAILSMMARNHVSSLKW